MMQQRLQTASKVVVLVIMLLQGLLGNVISFLPQAVDTALAFTRPTDLNIPVTTTQSCPITRNFLVYQGYNIVLSDLYIGDATRFHVFDTVGGSKVNFYNANNSLGGATFQAISNAKFKGTSQVTWAYAIASVNGHKQGLNNRSEMSAQAVFKLKATSYANMNTGNQSYQQVTDFDPSNGSYTVTNGQYVGQGSPTSVTAPDECANVYVAFCGDGVRDNGAQGAVYEGSPSNFNNIKFNANEECDDANTNNNDGCRNDCTLPPPPVCVHQLITTNPTINQPVQISCGAPSGFTSVRLIITRNGTQVFNQMQALSQYTFSYTPTVDGTYVYDCIETYTIPNNNAVNCGGSFSIAPLAPVCSGLTLTPATGGVSPLNVSYSCVGANSNQYSVNIVGNNGFEQTLSTANGVFSNLSAGSYTVTCTVGGNGSPACTKTLTVTPPAQPVDLTIVKTVSGSTVVNSGDIVTYKFVVTNVAGTNAKSWTLHDTLPAGQVTLGAYQGFLSDPANGTKCGSLGSPNRNGQENNQYVTNANLPVGQSCTYTLKAKVISSTPATQINNVCVENVVGTNNANETNTSNNCDDATVTVNPPASPVCSGLTLTPPNGGTSPFNVNYSCVGANSTQFNVTIVGNNGFEQTLTTPNGAFSNLAAGSYTVTCLVGGNGSPACTKTFTVNPPAPTPVIDLEIDKQHMNGSNSCETFNSGSLVGFKITVTNKGNTGARNFTVKDYLPAGYQFISTTNGGTHSNGVVTWTVPGPLAPNQSMTFYLTGRAIQEGNFINKTEVCNYEEAGEPQDADSNPCTMGASGSPSEDDEDDLCFNVVNPITPYIDIELVKDLVNPSHNMFNSGEVVTFTISVTNKGNVTATGVTVKDYLPLLALVNVTASNGGVVAGNLVTRTNINLLPNETKTFTVQGIAKYTSTNPDPCNKAEAGDYEPSGSPQDADSNGWTMGVNGNPVEDDEDKLCFWVNQPEPQNYDVELIKTVLQPNGGFVSGGLVPFKLTVYNNSNVAIPTFTVRDYLPAGIQFVSATDGGQPVAGAPQTIQWTIQGGLPAYGTKIIYLTGKILLAGRYDNCAEVGGYNGVSSSQTPRDVDSDPYNHPGQDIEDDESCAGFDVPTPNNPTTCDNLTVTPITGNVPLTINYNCTATNATTYTVQLIQNGITTVIGTDPIGSYTITNPGAYQVKCLVNNVITSPACQKTVTTNTAPFIDLNIKKLFADTNTPTHANFNSGDTITFKLIVGNSGNTTATNFTVKDYLPSSLQYISSQPNGVALGGNAYQWSIASLAPGATTSITIQAKIIQALWDKNKAEVCAYEEAGEPQDPDSDPCNMGPDGMPSEDDEDLIMWDVNDPTPSMSCDSLTLSPSTGTVPYTVSYNCNGTNAQTYVVKLFGVGLPANGQVVGNANQGTFVLSTTGAYTVQCFVNGTTTSVACTKPLVGSSTPAGPSPKCNYITVTPNAGAAPFNVTFFCNGGFSNQYVVNVVGPNGFSQSYVTSGGTVLLTDPGSYSFACTVGGATAPACNKTVTVLTGSCPPGQVLSGGQCVVTNCPNGATNPPLCNQCPPGQVLSGGQCVVTNCPNGATNPPLCNQCPQGKVFSGGQCIICPSCIPNVCANGAVNYPLCNECLPGKIFSGGQCITPPTPNACSSQCLGLDVQGEMGVGKTVTFTCNGSGGSTNQIWVYANGASTPLTVLQGPVATYTFNSAGTYQAKCVINGSVDYKCDFYKNYCLDTLTCAYKRKSNGALCAVQATLAPYYIQFVPPQNRVNVSAPVEYCTEAEVASLPCHDNSNLPNYGVIKNHHVCNQEFTISTGLCPNGAINPPACNQCATGFTRNGNQCVVTQCPNGATNPPFCNQCAPGNYWNGHSCIPTCLNGAINPPACNQCASGYNRNGYVCTVGVCTNGATNYPACNQCPSGYNRNGYSCTPVNCANGATNPPVCNQCAAGYTRNGNQCVIINCPNGATNPPACNQCLPGYSLINNVCTPDTLNYCGNGIVEINEDCDLGTATDRTIRNGPNKGRICLTTCRVKDATDAPKCMDIDPPSINEGEQFPFRWNVDLNKVTTATSCSDATAGKVLSNTMQCTFSIYNGKRGTTDPVKTFTIPCNADQGFDTQLMKFWSDRQSTKPFGRYVAIFDRAITQGIYGEYKIELNKITYDTCAGGSSTVRVSSDRTVCQYNFVVGDGYMIQKGANISTLQNNAIQGYYGFSSNTPRFDLYLKGVQQSLTLNAFKPTQNVSYLASDFVSKYDKLAKGGAGVTARKVPGKDIYIYDGSVTLGETSVRDNSTVIVKNGNLKLEGTIAKNVLYLVPDGTITLGGDANCNNMTDDPAPQIVQGILVAGKGFDSDYYLNTDKNKTRCANGSLRIRGTLIGEGVDNLINKRRTVFTDWFEGATFEYKIQHVLDGASLLINPNTALWDSLPGADELASILGVTKQ